MKILDKLFRRRKAPNDPQQIVQKIGGRKYKVTVYRGTIELNDVERIASIFEEVFHNKRICFNARCLAIARETAQRLHYGCVSIHANPYFTLLKYEIYL